MKRALQFSTLFAVSLAASAEGSAELALTNGRIFTGDTGQPWAEAIAIRGDTILAVGTHAHVATHTGPGTRTIDLGGKLVIPGINDAHVHAPFGSGEKPVRLQLGDNATTAAILAQLATEVARQPTGTLITGQLAPVLFDDAPTRAELDRVAPAHPVRLAPPGGHTALLNTQALRAWGIEEDAADPPGGWYGRDGDRLDGWLYEHAYWNPQHRLAARVADSTYVEALKTFEDEALRYGITSVQTMPLPAADRVERLLTGMGARIRWRVIDFRMAPFDGSPSPRAVKYVLDGTPIERGAALRAPYADAPSASGRLNYSEVEIAAMVANAGNGGSQLLVHAVGDAATAAVLQAMQAHADVDWPARRVRLEHADGLATDQLDAARRLGVIVVQNPAHFMGGLGPVRLGVERSGDYQKARSLLESGVHFALGSDGPLNPFLNMMFAARHPNPDEALSVAQSLRAYTHGAAYAESSEATKGRLLPGMLADLSVLSQDITRVDPAELPATRSLLTIVGGKVAWEAPPPAGGD